MLIWVQQGVESKRLYCSSRKNLHQISGRKDLWNEGRGLTMGVYKEGKNWKVQVYYKDWQGNRKRKQKRGFRTKGEAKEWERDFLQQQSQGVDIEFGNFLEIYYKDMDVRLREHTMYTKRYIIDLKIRPYFEKKILIFGMEVKTG